MDRHDYPAMAQPELEAAIARFMWSFEEVFHRDWSYSQGAICGSGYIADGGTFLVPKVEDEVDDWGNRGTLLETYRDLQEAMRQCGIKPTKPMP